MLVLAFLSLGSKVNAIYLTFVQELELPIRPTDIRAWKINSIILDIFGIIVEVFSMIDNVNWLRFFEKTFLVANISPEVVFRMLFLILSSTDVDF